MVANKAQQRIVQLSRDPIDVGTALSFLQTPRAGGISIFLGTTRQWTNGQETTLLTYESYKPMALKQMHRLIDMAESRWHIHQTCLLHRLGEVPRSEISVLIGVATSHRSEAFEACRFLIDQLKIQVPIWKQERHTDGSKIWIEGTLPPMGANS